MKIDIIMENRTGFHHSQARINLITHVLVHLWTERCWRGQKEEKKNVFFPNIFQDLFVYVGRLVGGRECGCESAFNMGRKKTPTESSRYNNEARRYAENASVADTLEIMRFSMFGPTPWMGIIFGSFSWAQYNGNDANTQIGNIFRIYCGNYL